MILHFKFNFTTIATMHLESLLLQNNIDYETQNFNEIEIL